jgi:hypothetical protein
VVVAIVFTVAPIVAFAESLEVPAHELSGNATR